MRSGAGKTRVVDTRYWRRRQGRRAVQAFHGSNLGDGDMMFAFDKKDLEAGVPRVPGVHAQVQRSAVLPNDGGHATLNTAMEHAEEGAMEFTLPLNVTGGPQALVTIKAVVQVPERQRGDFPGLWQRAGWPL